VSPNVVAQPDVGTPADADFIEMENACPEARTTQDEIEVWPLDVVVLDGSPSFDPDGPSDRPVRYEWVVT
jgi:hypothetical protein